MMVCRGIRGAITADDNTRASIFAATQELFAKLVEANQIEESQIGAVFLTTTFDLNAAFPATAVREMGWNNIALLCSHEIDVPEGLSKCIRALILINTEKEPCDLVNVYMKEAANLRSPGT